MRVDLLLNWIVRNLFCMWLCFLFQSIKNIRVRHSHISIHFFSFCCFKSWWEWNLSGESASNIFITCPLTLRSLVALTLVWKWQKLHLLKVLQRLLLLRSERILFKYEHKNIHTDLFESNVGVLTHQNWSYNNNVNFLCFPHISSSAIALIFIRFIGIGIHLYRKSFRSITAASFQRRFHTQNTKTSKLFNICKL